MMHCRQNSSSVCMLRTLPVCLCVASKSEAHRVSVLQAASAEDFAPPSSERESLLEAQLNALREQLSSRDAELAELRHQPGESASHPCHR